MERLWDWFYSWWQAKKKFSDLKAEVNEEINYNCMPGVGSPEGNFMLNGHKELLKMKELDKEAAEYLSKIISAGQLFNSYGGLRQPQINAGQVKSFSQYLKTQINQ